MEDSALLYEIVEEYCDEDTFSALINWELNDLFVVKELLDRAIKEKLDEEIQMQIES